MSDLNEFNKNGFIIKKNLFSKDEIVKLINFINSNSDKETQSRKTKSSTGSLNLTIWNHPSEDLFGKFSTNERIVKPMEKFLGDEADDLGDAVLTPSRFYDMFINLNQIEIANGK